MKIELTVEIPDSISLDLLTIMEYKMFLQAMLFRRIQGGMRYGDRPKKRQQYMTRLKKELDHYIDTGNHEQLLNIANYAFLESVAPQNPKYHWNNTVDSVTRPTMGV